MSATPSPGRLAGGWTAGALLPGEAAEEMRGMDEELERALRDALGAGYDPAAAAAAAAAAVAVRGGSGEAALSDADTEDRDSDSGRRDSDIGRRDSDYDRRRELESFRRASCGGIPLARRAAAAAAAAARFSSLGGGGKLEAARLRAGFSRPPGPGLAAGPEAAAGRPGARFGSPAPAGGDDAAAWGGEWGSPVSPPRTPPPRPPPVAAPRRARFSLV
jgi:hypothetical protein